jgi:hypothetical protein
MKKQVSPRKKHKGRTSPKDDPGDILGAQLADALVALLTIEGVEDIGKPVTVISPDDLPPDFLGFIERLRGGAIELEEEMLLLTLAPLPGRRRKRELALERLRQALAVLCRHATEKGVSAAEIAAVLEEAKGKLRPPG